MNKSGVPSQVTYGHVHNW